VAYDFDQVIDRCHTDSAKWCRYNKDGHEDVLPLWVADMDFAAPEPVIRALQERVAHGVFGYGMPPDGLREIIQGRLAQLYNWQVETDDILFFPGVVTGFTLACCAIGEPGDETLVEPPVYPPMLAAPAEVGRIPKTVQLVEGDERYERDLDRFEAAITERTSLFLLCSPHNPVGRVFERGELERLAEVCLRHDVVICSDEIHCDLVFQGHPHIPIASLAPEIAAQTITLMAPSKTYNIAGLSCSVAVIQNPELRTRLKETVPHLVSHVNLLGYTAALAAYRDGQEWLDALLAYLKANRDYLIEYLAAHMPGIRCHKPEGTYLAWLDCRDTGIPGNPHEFFLEHARVALNDGASFGTGGEGFVRLNFGCPRAILTEALDRMQAALDAL
jgi:cystathionine beta-lyase